MNIIRTHALGRDDGGYQPPGMQYKINIIPRVRECRHWLVCISM